MKNEKITKEEIDKLFEVDKEGCYVNLIIPTEGELNELNLIGKCPVNLSLEEVIRMKQYANKLYEQANKNTLK